MLHRLIKEATQPLHAQLEGLMHSDEIMNGELTYGQYRRILAVNYLITAEYEPQLLAGLSSAMNVRLNLHNRIKHAALLRDLLEAGIDAHALQKKAGFKPSREHLLGCLYVLEGATLGGNIIVEKLRDNRHLKAHQLQFYYYQVYGEQLISYWKQFCELLNEQPERDYEKITEGAKLMYGAFIDLNLSTIIHQV